MVRMCTLLLSNHVLGLSKLAVNDKREIVCCNAPTCGSRRQLASVILVKAYWRCYTYVGMHEGREGEREKNVLLVVVNLVIPPIHVELNFGV